jgi:hypothetical protein
VAQALVVSRPKGAMVKVKLNRVNDVVVKMFNGLAL